MVRTRSLIPKLKELAQNHPAAESRASASEAELLRTAFHISLVVDRAGDNATIADVGGGIGLFSLGCAAVGMNVFLVDDFQDSVNKRVGDSVLDYHRSMGIQIVARDVVSTGLGMDCGSLDAVTSFDSMEHWHHSPKRLFAGIVETLRPGGVFVLGVPNSLNLRKRVMVPLGLAKWSSMDDWYEAETFRGHVREPDVADLRYIARDMRLENIEVIGRNWLGYKNRRSWIRALTPIVDVPLRALPTLCSDIYMVGRTSAHPTANRGADGTASASARIVTGLAD